MKSVTFRILLFFKLFQSNVQNQFIIIVLFAYFSCIQKNKMNK